MQALILAAGLGARLRPMTDEIPKAMVQVGGVPLLIRALDNLSKYPVSEVILVVGHRQEYIREHIGERYREMKITYIENPLYMTTNNVYSLYLAKDSLHDDLIMLECDLIYDGTVIDELLKSEADCNILVSPFNAETMNGTVVSVDENSSVRKMHLKKHQDRDFNDTDQYKTVNIYFFSKDFLLKRYLPALETYVQTQSVNSYYEMVLGALIYFGNDRIQAVIVPKEAWCEIDNAEDLERAQKKFSEWGG